MARAATGTYREVALEHLARHPGVTAHELGKATGAKGNLLGLLRLMEGQGLVVAAAARRPGQGRPVSVWRIAPAGTAPGPAAPESPQQIEQRQARQRAYQRKRRRLLALPTTAVPFLPPGAACVGADPEIFFPRRAAVEARAMALCAGCPISTACFNRAVANGEESGIWGGVNFDREDVPRLLRAIASGDAEAAGGRPRGDEGDGIAASSQPERAS